MSSNNNTKANFFSVSGATAKQQEAKKQERAKNAKPMIKYPLPVAGGHFARVVQVAFVGLQRLQPFNKQEREPKQQMRLTFELVNSHFDRVVDQVTGETESQPHWLTATVNVSGSDKSNAIKWAKALGMQVDKINEYSFKTNQGAEITVREYDTDWSTAIDKVCQIFVQHESWKDKTTGEDREKASIKDVMPPMAGVDVPPLQDPSKVVVFSPQDPRPSSVATFNEFPQWVQGIITGALDWNEAPLKKAIDAGVQPSSAEDTPVKAEEPKAKAKPEPKLMKDDDVPFEADSNTDDDDPWV